MKHPNFDKKYYCTCIRNLKEQNPHLSCEEIAKLAGIGKTTAAKYLSGLLRPHSSRRWTREDVAFLEANAEVMPVAAIAEKLGRTKIAVYAKANLLGLSLHLTLNNYSATYLAENLGISSCTTSRWCRLGLLKAKRVSKQWSILSTDFAQFCRTHPSRVSRCDKSIIDWLSGENN